MSPFFIRQRVWFFTPSPQVTLQGELPTITSTCSFSSSSECTTVRRWKLQRSRRKRLGIDGMMRLKEEVRWSQTRLAAEKMGVALISFRLLSSFIRDRVLLLAKNTRILHFISSQVANYVLFMVELWEWKNSSTHNNPEVFSLRNRIVYYLWGMATC